MQQEGVWKYCYWLEEKRFNTLQQEIAAQGLEMRQAKKNPCEALLDDIGYAAPGCWSVICNYDALPWFEASPFAGKTLIVTSAPLDSAYDDCLETTITPLKFKPKRMPDKVELEALINDPQFVQRKPESWDQFPQEMGEQIVKGLARMSGKPSGTWEDLFKTWTAVHANFVAPRFRVEDELAAPYSIGDTFSISSCCVELFNLLNSNEAALLVRPCTGAALLQVMERDRYYMVRLVKKAVQA